MIGCIGAGLAVRCPRIVRTGGWRVGILSYLGYRSLICSGGLTSIRV